MEWGSALEGAGEVVGAGADFEKSATGFHTKVFHAAGLDCRLAAFGDPLIAAVGR